jgi:uncharacterized protein YcbX
MAEISALYRYPVKGLSPERIAEAQLAPGQTLRGDRVWAIENGPSGFDPADPKYLPKQRFLMLMRDERLARLKTRLDDATQTLVIDHDGSEVARGRLDDGAGRTAIEIFFSEFLAGGLRGQPRLLHAAGHSFSDVARKVVSIINLASVAALEGALGTPVDPLRFRGNVYVAGWPAWREFDLMDRKITIGGATLRVVKRIVRCAATNVDPQSGARDMNIPQTLMQTFGHTDCGVYAEVVEGGMIASGYAITT